MDRIPHVPLSVVLGVLLLVSGAGMYGYGWYEDATRDCPSSVTIDRVEEPSSADATNFSALTHDQQGVFLLGLDEDDGGYISTSDDEIMDIARSLPSQVTYDGTTYDLGYAAALCAHGLFPKLVGGFTVVLSVVVFVIGGVLQIVFRRW